MLKKIMNEMRQEAGLEEGKYYRVDKENPYHNPKKFPDLKDTDKLAKDVERHLVSLRHWLESAEKRFARRDRSGRHAGYKTQMASMYNAIKHLRVAQEALEKASQYELINLGL
jgi:hypothetical protein